MKLVTKNLTLPYQFFCRAMVSWYAERAYAAVAVTTGHIGQHKTALISDCSALKDNGRRHNYAI